MQRGSLTLRAGWPHPRKRMDGVTMMDSAENLLICIPPFASVTIPSRVVGRVGQQRPSQQAKAAKDPIGVDTAYQKASYVRSAPLNAGPLRSSSLRPLPFL